jgi:hypothetical protein
MSDNQRPQGLGPNQLKWLRDNIPPFNEAWKDVQASDKYAAKVRAELEKNAGPQ